MSLNLKHYLNPFWRELDNVLTDSETFKEGSKNTQKKDKSPITSDYFSQEQEYLTNTEKLLIKDASTNISRLEMLEKDMEETMVTIQNSTGDDKDEAIADYKDQMKKAKVYIKTINRLLEQISQPYFGKIIFNRAKTSDFPARQIATHIGKFAYIDKTSQIPLITDWRAPIANLYYRNAGLASNVSFESPAGIQTGDLTEKLQLDIKSGKIQQIYKVTTGNATADAFLLSQLQKRIGKKLQDIVSTIQEEQNNIIREDINHPVVIQGVAGSGKTTILLHRIAYLSYAFGKDIDISNSLVIAPNKMFLDYISDVLPSLGVESIGRSTYILWAKSVLGWDKNCVLNEEPSDLEIKEFKGAVTFINLVEKFLDDFESDVLDKMPLDRTNINIVSKYYSLKEESPKICMKERFDIAIGYAFAQEQFQDKTTGDFMGILRIAEERRKKLQNYFAKRLSPIEIYKSLFKFEHIFKEFNIAKAFSDKIRKHTLSRIKRTRGFLKYDAEDLAPILHIHQRMFGSVSLLRDYILVDEAQDMSLFQLLTLYKASKKGNITFAGDLAQSIIPPFYIKDWKSLLDLLKAQDVENLTYHQLDKCYRTTVEIAQYARNIFAKNFPESYKLPQAVLRHGDKVKEIITRNDISRIEKVKKNSPKDNDLEKLITILRDEVDKAAATVAIICKGYLEADNLFKKLEGFRRKIGRNIYDYSSDDYRDGILVLPVERSKGLEFDSVIIVDRHLYEDSFLDAKLLYVAVTRALHRLYVLERK